MHNHDEKEPTIKVEKTADDWCNEGESAYKKKNYQEAISCFRNALNQDLNSVRAWNQSGQIYYLQKQFDTALDCFIKSLSIQPNNQDALKKCLDIIDILFNQASFYNRRLYYLNQVLKHAPNNADAWSVKESIALSALKHNGILYYKQKELIKALSFFREALQIRPDDQDAIDYCLRIVSGLLDQGLYDLSTKAFVDIHDMNGNDENLSIMKFWWKKAKKIKEVYKSHLSQKDDKTSDDIANLHSGGDPEITWWKKVNKLPKPQIAYMYAVNCALYVSNKITNSVSGNSKLKSLPTFWGIQQCINECMPDYLQEKEKTEDLQKHQYNSVSTCPMTTPSQEEDNLLNTERTSDQESSSSSTLCINSLLSSDDYDSYKRPPPTKKCSALSTTQAFFNSSPVVKTGEKKNHGDDNPLSNATDDHSQSYKKG